MNKIKSLALVDDDEVYSFVTKKLMEDSKLVDIIKIYKNGLEAIEFLKKNSSKPEALPEIILLDLAMPVMDGWQFLEEYLLLKPRIGKKITIYLVTSSISPRDFERAKTISEVSDYIIKPVTKQNLVDMIKHL